MKNIHQQLAETLPLIRSHTNAKPDIGIILGTGLGALAKEIQVETTLEYGDIPHFPLSTVEAHAGKLIFGTLGGKSVVAMQGRFHYYEGYSMKQITYPVRVMKELGIHTILISNACGGMNPVYSPGDLMIMEDHINLIGDNPLIGQNDDDLGSRFPDMSEPYSRELINLAEGIALEKGIKVQRGVYVAVAGPNLETRAEYRFLRIIGADVVGMSTIPECIVANHGGIRVFGMSVVTDECFPEALKPANIEDIIETAGKAEPNLTYIMKTLIKRL
ncbi:purine-nucleoside phosphorylase [candidate division LCP-89 bacterium B3_LCP]|uniref:Purine nucleoside phosphorylase n=1 Tax=candidate division LCP-89 bacterium B3_LCP TaxID=2012998 RepID=A0A532V0H4_UNCL8|nr:MAG: purine-nucleoside phosphorylase [candidate division LCP-89 bacterium B3_LCP]